MLDYHHRVAKPRQPGRAGRVWQSVGDSWRTPVWLTLILVPWITPIPDWWSPAVLAMMLAVSVIALPVPIPSGDGMAKADEWAGDMGLTSLARLSPVEDARRWRQRIRRRRGNRILRELGVVRDAKDTPARDYDVAWNERTHTLGIGEGLGAGLAPERLETVMKTAAPCIDMVDARITHVDGVRCMVEFHEHPRYAELDPPRTLDRLPYVSNDGHGLALEIGMGEHYTPHVLQLRNLPGLCVGGASRSGKTRAVTLLLAGLLHAGYARALVIDCKAGSDYESPLGRDTGSVLSMGATVIADDGSPESLNRVREALDHEVRDMRERQRRYRPAYWDHTVTEADPVRLVVVDECQQLWAKTRDRGKAETLQAIRGDLLTLIRAGASAGWITILISQDWTGDVIDTAVRSQLARIAFWSGERSKTQAVLGWTNEQIDSMSFTGVERDRWRGLSIIDAGDGGQWVRWDRLA
ncbi:hypothetical protein [Bifidobacterium simiarum]|uniref:hypothetical protein n=1 Tax=Bifidobacterium simiarum TaxID=2045441 RepID=UPI001BDC1ED2|nr:hypothetical protein [Bifidobacterium simiarum]MBT1167182.1 hypothetical protein [Bifidobacterium simiarum]